jgi:hypothetical protein
VRRGRGVIQRNHQQLGEAGHVGQWDHVDAPRIITSGGEKVYPAVGANSGRTVVGYSTRDYSPVPTATDHSCGRGFMDTTDTGYPSSGVHYIDLSPVCLDYALSSSTDGYASQTRVSTQSSNPYIEFSSIHRRLYRCRGGCGRRRAHGLDRLPRSSRTLDESCLNYPESGHGCREREVKD